MSDPIYTVNVPLERNPLHLWHYYAVIPKEVTAALIEGDNRRVKITYNNRITASASLMPMNGEHYILINQQIRKKFALSVGDKLEIKLVKDRSEYGMEMPEELEVMLQQEPEADKYFHDLTPGKQRSLIYLVLKIKSPDKRINKALAIIHHLKEVEGKLDFKRLNETIKFYNNQPKDIFNHRLS